MKSVPVINTERLTLKEITAQNAPYIVKWRSDPEVYKYFINPHKITLEEHLSWFEDRYANNPNRYDFMAYRVSEGPLGTCCQEGSDVQPGAYCQEGSDVQPDCKQAGKKTEPVGVFGISRVSDTEAEVNYILGPVYQGKGYAKEGILALEHYVKSEWGCKTTIAEIHKDNQASLKFIKKLGYVKVNTQGVVELYRKEL